MTIFWSITSSPGTTVLPQASDYPLRDFLAKGERPPAELIPAYEFKDGDTAVDFPLSFGVGLMSQRMRDTVSAHSNPGEVDWIPVIVRDSQAALLPYWIPLWPLLDDVYNERGTTRDGNGRIIRWVLDEKKIAGRQAFKVPVTTLGFIVSGSLKEALTELDLRGVDVALARTR